MLLVGLAVAFLRWYAPKGSDASAVALPFVPVAIGSAFLIGSGNAIRRGHTRFLGIEIGESRRFGWLVLAAGSVAAVEVLMVLTGWASGVAK